MSPSRAGVGAVLLAAGAAFAATDSPRIVRAELVREGERHLLNADVEYRFSDAATEALQNGVPLTLQLNLQVSRERRYRWDETVVDEHWSFRLRYHSLAKLYQWVEEDGRAPRGFASLAALLEEMGAVRRLEVPGAGVLVPGQSYQARLAVSLDIESLPLPLRPVAYLSPAWYLASPWFPWSFVD
jgi:hypothetical protein